MNNDFVIDILNQDSIKLMVVNVCLVLADHGITEVHVGSLMRLVGVDENVAAKHDDELMVITGIKQLANRNNQTNNVIPPGTTLH